MTSKKDLLIGLSIRLAIVLGVVGFIYLITRPDKPHYKVGYCFTYPKQEFDEDNPITRIEEIGKTRYRYSFYVKSLGDFSGSSADDFASFERFHTVRVRFTNDKDGICREPKEEK